MNRIILFLTLTMATASMSSAAAPSDDYCGDLESWQQWERIRAEEPRATVKQVRWTEREWKEVTRAARIAGLVPSVFIRFTVLQKIKSESE